MNLRLIRKDRRPDGIFSELRTEEGELVAVTLEHAYPDGQGGWMPKIPNGTFRCVRGSHRLHGMDHDFETFEITGVAGHKDLLFHSGNKNADSEGCVLTGQAIAEVGAEERVTNSRMTFSKLMLLQEGLDEFPLTVEGLSMSAASYDLYIEQGATFTRGIQIQVNSPATLTGASLRGQIRKKYSDPDPVVASFSFTAIDESGNSVMSLSASVTAAIPVDPASTYSKQSSWACYDVELVLADSTVIRILEGDVEISPEVTR